MPGTITVMSAGWTCAPARLYRGLPEDGTITISAPVGPARPPRCLNVPKDVETIQGALNQFSYTEGGPENRLVVDGIMGPLTAAAIKRFQEKWGLKPKGWNHVDGIVDPNGKTIRRLRMGPNYNRGSLPALFVSRIPRVMQIVTAARAALTSAKRYYTRKRILGDLPSLVRFGEADAKKVDRHFHVAKLPDPVRRIEQIEKIFFAMQTAIGYVPMGLLLAVDEPPGIARGSIMFTFMSGYHQRKQSDVDPNGLAYASIYLCPYARSLQPESFVYCMIHELAHFVGPIGMQIDDHAYYHQNSAEYFRLGPEQAYRNADSYSRYAFDVIGKPDLKLE